MYTCAHRQHLTKHNFTFALNMIMAVMHVPASTIPPSALSLPLLLPLPPHVHLFDAKACALDLQDEKEALLRELAACEPLSRPASPDTATSTLSRVASARGYVVLTLAGTSKQTVIDSLVWGCCWRISCFTQEPRCDSESMTTGPEVVAW